MQKEQPSVLFLRLTSASLVVKTGEGHVVEFITFNVNYVGGHVMSKPVLQSSSGGKNKYI